MSAYALFATVATVSKAKGGYPSLSLRTNLEYCFRVRVFGSNAHLEVIIEHKAAILRNRCVSAAHDSVSDSEARSCLPGIDASL